MLLKRTFALCVLGVGLSAALLQAQDLFVLPGAGSTSGNIQALVTSPLNIYRTFNAGLGSFALLPNVDASKFYVVSSASSSNIVAMDRALLTPTPVANLSQPATQAIITPDSRVLVVAAGAVYLYSTTTNAPLTPGGLSQGNGITTFAVASSLDSALIYALGTAAKGGETQLSAISAGTSSYELTTMLTFSQSATALSVGPNGLLYVSLPNQIVELDPRTLQTTPEGTISVSGTPGPLVFTPDGQYALGINQSSFGSSLIIASLKTHAAVNSNVGLAEVAALQVSGVNTVLALYNQGLYQITISPLSAVPITGLTGLLALTATNDVPTSNHTLVDAAFLVSSTDVYQYNPATEAITNEPLAPGITPGVLAFAVPTATSVTSQPTSVLAYGASQTIAPGATSEPLVVQVLGTGNVPLSGIPVQFQSSGNGATLSATSTTTSSNGYALTYLTAPSTTGIFTVTATVGLLTANFPVTVQAATQGGTPTLTVVSGQGQLMAVDTSTEGGLAYGSPLQVLAIDANGNPIANLAVTFTVPVGEGTIQVNGSGGLTQTVNTNSSGIASVDFLTTSLTPNGLQQGFNQSLITASAANIKPVTIYVTTVDSSPTPSVYFLKPVSGTTVTGGEGSTLTGAVQVHVVSAAGIGIPNISLSVTNSHNNPALFPSVSCNAPGGVVLTDSTGLGSCDLTFGPRLGSGTFVANIGNTHHSIPFPFNVTPGAPSTIQILQGNNQTGGPGQKLPYALVVNVTDTGGNIVPGAPVSWQVVTSGTLTLSNVITTTDTEGDASAVATLGLIGGVAQVQVTAGSVTATFNITVNIPTVGIQKVSGDQQTAFISTAFSLALVVQVVDSNGAGVVGTQVNFQVTSGDATLGSSSVLTDSTGQASTTVTAGVTPGAITVSATSSAFTASFTLTAQPKAPYNITVVNGASFNPNTGISPGGIATVQGLGILPGVQGLLVATPDSNGQLPTTFSGVTITFNGTPAPIYYVQDTNGSDQVTVQVPVEVQPGPAVTVEVSVANEGSTSLPVPVKPLAPGIFTSVYGGKTYAAAVRPDNTQVSPTNPAQRGETIQLYVTGLGQGTPPIATNTPGVANQTLVSPLIVGLNNGGVPLTSVVYGPGLIGTYIVIMQVPVDTQTGPYQPIGLIAYDPEHHAYFAQATYIPIQ